MASIAGERKPALRCWRFAISCSENNQSKINGAISSIINVNASISSASSANGVSKTGGVIGGGVEKPVINPERKKKYQW
jgi:hypothetical protein